MWYGGARINYSRVDQYHWARRSVETLREQGIEITHSSLKENWDLIVHYIPNDCSKERFLGMIRHYINHGVV